MGRQMRDLAKAVLGTTIDHGVTWMKCSVLCKLM